MMMVTCFCIEKAVLAMNAHFNNDCDNMYVFNKNVQKGDYLFCNEE